MTQNKRLTVIAFTTLLLLVVPLLAMQFTNEVHWTIFDFLIAGLLLFGTGFTLDFIIRKVNKKVNRIVLFIVTIAILLLIWLELAVGIFETPLAGS
ncbi:hypothetical protein ACFS5M_10500 [Lacinutrix iliipiscaria]|uniref:Uncharacterized protein n=1 Tax=Lacinutrix iliipiscaria TaxID=1230532 RepID=A0ABW5WMY6_9FLAO